MRHRPTGTGPGARGQAAVEFTIFLVALVVMLMLLVQLGVLGIQKWQFNHFASYGARSWSVNKKDSSPETVLLETQVFALLRWRLIGSLWVKFMWAGSPTTKTIDGDDYSGVEYTGVEQIMPLFKPFLGDLLLGTTIPPAVTDLLGISVPSTGLVRFTSFVPMEHEPAEDPDRYDNDCSDPCDDNAQ